MHQFSSRFFLIPAVLILALGLAPPLAAGADLNGDGKTTIMVLGDSLGDGMYVGLYRTLRDDPEATVFRLSKIGTGLFNFDMDAWHKKLAQVITERKPDVAVVMLGGNDPQPIRLPGRERYAFKTKKWKDRYTALVDEYMRLLIDAGLAVFWVGLPSMRDPEYDQDIQYLNQLYKDRADRNGVKFIPIRDLTVDENNHYTAYGMDGEGRRRLLRANDGKHFTGPGYEVLAGRVLETIESELRSFKVVSARE